MKSVVRTFFKTLRVLIGPFMLLAEVLMRPKGMVRPAQLQAKVDEACRDLVLYQYKTCPFCIKVRQEICRLSLNIKKIDAQQPGDGRATLQHGGGQMKVPCLHITNLSGQSRWLYESSAIIAYLDERFSGSAAPV